jgi:hypothetical protein
LATAAATSAAKSFGGSFVSPSPRA